MAKLNIDLTGREGLVSSYQGDLNDTAAVPHLRYIAGDSQMADGIYDPLKLDGYLSPANNKFADLTVSATNEITAREYDAINDVIYFAEDGRDMHTLDGFTDTTATTFTLGSNPAVDSRYDTEIYELYGNPSIFYLNHYQSPNGPGMTLGMYSMDPAKGLALIDSDLDNFANDTSEYIQNGDMQKLAQKFDTSTFRGLTVTGLRLGLQYYNSGGDAQTYTIKVGIQTDTAGRPSGTWVTNAELTYTDTAISTFFNKDYYDDYYFTFTTAPTLSSSTTYHIVVEVTVAAELDAGDFFCWRRTDGTGTLYAAGQAQQYPSGGPWANADTTNESFDFTIYARKDNTLVVPDSLSGATTYTQNPTDGFLHKSDNGLLYIFADNYVHKFDGSVTGGTAGTFTAEVLSFPSYIDLVDALSTQSLMYIAIQGKGSESSADQTFESDVMGLYVWDRQSTVLNIQSFIPCYGARELKKIFLTANGDIRIMTIGEDGFTEIRGIENGRLVVLKRLGRKAYPNYRDGFDTLNNLIAWFGADGIIYGLGSVYGGAESIFKLGDVSAEVSGTLTAGTLLAGNYDATQARQAAYLTWSDNAGKTITKWYPHGDGTISSVAQLGHVGNVYTPVKQFGTLAQINYVRVYCRPTTNTGATVIATIKTYYNQSSTAAHSKQVTQKMASDGFFYLPLGKKSVHAIQFEIEFSTSQTLGDDDFNPMFIEVDYEPTGKKK